MKIAGYMRVSTDHQTNLNQEIRITEFCKRREWEIIEIYQDVESGRKRKREGLNKLLSDARKDKFDKVVAVRVDRLSRSLIDLIEISGKLSDNAVSISFTEHDIDISSSMGRAMFQIMGVFAELEREIIIERTKAGQRRARKEGKRIGRPKINGMTIDKIRRLNKEGLSIRQISKDTGVSVGSVQKVVSGKRGVSPVKKPGVHNMEVI